MADWKYIMLEVDGTHVPVLFPPVLVHEDVARHMKAVTEKTLKAPVELVSAGFVTGLIASSCNGKSESLNGLKSRGAIDRALINEYPYAHGRTDGIACEPMIIETALRMLSPAFAGSAEAYSDESPRYQNGRCKGCNAPRKHHHRTGCPYED